MYSSTNKPSLQQFLNKAKKDHTEGAASSVADLPVAAHALKMGEKEKKIILIAEDNAINLKTLSVFITTKKCPVILTQDGEQAFQLYKLCREHLGVILMDEYMPKKSGLEVMQMIRADEAKHPNLPRTPIIFITGDTSEESKRKILAADADAYFTKPFDRQLLNDKMSEFMHISTPPFSTRRMSWESKEPHEKPEQENCDSSHSSTYNKVRP